jgi:hypothetical protein
MNATSTFGRLLRTTVFLGIAAVAGVAQGQQPWQAACEGDVQKFCKDTTGAKTLECLATNQDQLSDGCASFVWKYQIAQICQADRERLCKDATVPLGKCFQQNEKELSPKCREALVKGSKKYRAEKKADQPEAAPEKTAEKTAKPEGKKAAKAKAEK